MSQPNHGRRNRLMKYMMLCICFIVLSTPARPAHKPKRKQLRCIDATYSNIDGIRKVGRVYEFLVETRREGILIDSVWFGATPVPCDVHDPVSRLRINKPLRKGQYLVRANRDLYANYPADYDSSLAFQRFVPPFNFRGTACLMFYVKGKRGYTPVMQARKVEGKQLR